LAQWSGISVASTGLTTLNALADAEGVELISLGGVVRHISQGTVGPLAEEALARFTADAVFMSADGVVAGRGVSEASAEQTAVKGKMIERAAAVYVLAEAGKLGHAGSH
jgi:DeoR/GlpR family transcriptional regulator of sugar metabolism